MKANPEKVRVWYQKALQVKGMSDSLYNLAQELKIAIVKKSDGKEGDVDNIKNREDLEASTQVMLAPGKGRGKELYKAINRYRDQVITMVSRDSSSATASLPRCLPKPLPWARTGRSTCLRICLRQPL